MEQSTRVEPDGKIDRINRFAHFYGSPAIWIVAVSLDVHHAVEELVLNGHDDADAVSQAIDDHLWSGEIGSDHGRNDGRATRLRIARESLDTLANANVVDGRAVGVGSARISDARIRTGQVGWLTIFGGVTVWINSTLRN